MKFIYQIQFTRKIKFTQQIQFIPEKININTQLQRL